MADFPPVAPEFHQRTHRVRLKNLGTTDKKSSHKIKHKKIPRVDEMGAYDMEKYKRIFVIVLDSLGIGEMPDAARFGDHDVDTFGHICDTVGTLNIPNLKKLGLLNLHPTKEMEEEKHPIAYYTRLKETSNGKDTMTCLLYTSPSPRDCS